jgi:hypothetical protein
VSGPDRGQYGSLIELTEGGAQPLTLADGSTPTFLEDGDTVTIGATAPGTDGGRISLGELTGRVEPPGDRPVAVPFARSSVADDHAERTAVGVDYALSR